MAIALRAVLAIPIPLFARVVVPHSWDAARLDQSADRARLLTEIRVWRFPPGLLRLRHRFLIQVKTAA
jgi:hypothetical protein